MNITIKKTSDYEPAFWTEGYAEHIIEIAIDKSLPKKYQEGVVVHEIIECYCPFLCHEKVEELTGYILDGLGQLSVSDKSEAPPTEQTTPQKKHQLKSSP